MAEELRPIETCPNGHRYNTWKYGDTCPVCGAKIAPKAKEKPPEELAKEKEQQMKNRVCGWLVCVKGPNEGLDYRIKEGKNFIGSDPNMDIYIKGDKKIEKRNHSIIIYDAKNRECILLPGDSKGLVYLNNQVVYTPVVLEERDQIELGACIFSFVPFYLPENDTQID